MAIAAHYNQRPVGRGRKKGFLARFFSGLFPVRGDGGAEVIRKLVFLTALSSFIYFGGSVGFDLVGDWYQNMKMRDAIRQMQSQLDLSDEVIEKVMKEKPQILAEFIGPYNFNNDLVGYIKFEDRAGAEKRPMIEYLVYQAKDNDYYLDHAFDHTDSVGGAIFADYRNEFLPDALSANTILYGHNIFTGEYFTKLTNYHATKSGEQAALDFYKKYPVLEFDTIYERSKWKVFAAVLFNTKEKYGEVYEYNNMLEFYSVDEFNEFILNIMDRSVLFTDVDLQYGDNILTLSTCYYPMGKEVDTRLVVFARKVRSGESESVNVNKAVYNDREFRFEKQAQRYGTKWQGRVWDTSYLKTYR